MKYQTSKKGKTCNTNSGERDDAGVMCTIDIHSCYIPHHQTCTKTRHRICNDK